MSGDGVEIIIGIQRDADFGPMLVIGAGGTMVEVLDDVIVTPAPASARQVRDLLAHWKGNRLLDGSVGAPGADVDALVDVAVAVSRFAAAADTVSSLDLNPVIVHPRGQGVSIVDALIVTEERSVAENLPLAAD
jgi:acetyltransferase